VYIFAVKARSALKGIDASLASIWKTADAKSVVMSLAKACKILEIFDGQEAELNLSEISRLTELDVGTVHRLVRTLVGLGYLEQGESAKRYRLGLKVVDLGFNAISRIEVQSISRPILLSLIGSIIGAASVAVMSGTQVQYIERVQVGLAPFGVARGIGSRIPAYCSAVGRAILAFLPPKRRLEILNSEKRVKLTPHTVVSISEIERLLDDVRKQGYVFCDQEMIPGIRALAAPILNGDGCPVASLSVGAPSFPISAEEFVAYTAPRVVDAVRTISKSLNRSKPLPHR
jgi:IclR family transcriptional regulator, pca regulon regulatory protein